jgi:hypothetical protein
MTRRDYVLISKLLAAHRTHQISAEAHWLLCANFANALADENKNFDQERFMQACEANR